MKKSKEGIPKFMRWVKLLFILFLLIFVARWAYEIYFSSHDITISYSQANPESVDIYSERKTSNIASDKISQKDLTGQNVTIDQKYEKTANISATSHDFQKDVSELESAIAKTDAVIQSENTNGLEGSQVLVMSIGVKPDNFDVLVDMVRGVGELTGFTVNKTDKTDEFRQLMAQQATLEKTRDAYVAIKKNGGAIQDLLKIEEKILEVEAQLQDLGVNAGLFTTENSLCTVVFSLTEGKIQKNDISVRFILNCAKISFFFTVAFFATILFFAGMLLVFLWIVLWLLEKVKIATADRHEGDKDTEEVMDSKE